MKRLIEPWADMAIAAIVLAFLILGCHFAHAQNTPLEASFRVGVPGAQGSGTGISPNLVVTNAHVAKRLENTAKVWHSFDPDHTWQGKVVCFDPGADLALIWVEAGGLPYVKINPTGLSTGDEIVSYGYGMSGKVRMAEGIVNGQKAMLSQTVGQWDTGILVEPGDSGSGIFNKAGELVGITRAKDTPGEMPGRNFAISAVHLITTGQAWEAQCGGGMCDSFRSAGRQAAGGMVPVRPPLVRPNDGASPSIPPSPTVPAAPAPSLNVDDLAGKILDKLADDPRFKGPKGDAGPAGPPGKDGRDGKDAEIDEDALANKVLAKIDIDLIARRAAGMVNIQPPSVPASSRHVVLVADQNASYWPRLASNLQRAREAYHRIDFERPPANENVGELPALVWYENGVPVRQVRGTYDVTNELSTIARGEVTPLN